MVLLYHRLAIFQSTLPRRERRQETLEAHLVEKISIHAPAKGATRLAGKAHLPAAISIHAPAKGATRARIQAGAVPAISIHAPAKGATGGRSAARREDHHFNPRSREGSDANLCIRLFHLRVISIHAPAKGATFLLINLEFPVIAFQSTLPRRERPVAGSIITLP